MTDSLLDLLSNRQAVSTAQLADALHTTTEMIEARLERYEQLGYVKKTVMSAHECECGGSCKKCKKCGISHSEASPVVFWEKL